MGKIKKILENELIGGTQSTDIYPVTSTKAVYDENNKTLDTKLKENDIKISELGIKQIYEDTVVANTGNTILYLNTKFKVKGNLLIKVIDNPSSIDGLSLEIKKKDGKNRYSYIKLENEYNYFTLDEEDDYMNMVYIVPTETNLGFLHVEIYLGASYIPNAYTELEQAKQDEKILKLEEEQLVLAPAKSVSFIADSEFIFAIVDKDGNILWGKRWDNSTVDLGASDIKDAINNLNLVFKDLNNQVSDINETYSKISNSISFISNNEFIFAITDNESNILWGKRWDNSTYDNGDVPPSITKLINEVSSNIDSILYTINNIENDIEAVERNINDLKINVQNNTTSIASLEEKLKEIGDISVESKDKGYFTSEEELKKAYPSPKVGEFANVNGIRFICSVEGEWFNTGEAIGEGSIELSEYAKKTELNNAIHSIKYGESYPKPSQDIVIEINNYEDLVNLKDAIIDKLSTNPNISLKVLLGGGELFFDENTIKFDSLNYPNASISIIPKIGEKCILIPKGHTYTAEDALFITDTHYVCNLHSSYSNECGFIDLDNKKLIIVQDSGALNSKNVNKAASAVTGAGTGICKFKLPDELSFIKNKSKDKMKRCTLSIDSWYYNKIYFSGLYTDNEYLYFPENTAPNGDYTFSGRYANFYITNPPEYPLESLNHDKVYITQDKIYIPINIGRLHQCNNCNFITLNRNTILEKFIIDGLYFLGSKKVSSTSSSNNYTIDIQSTSKIKVSNIHLKGVSSGIYINGANESKVDNCHIEDVYGYGIRGYTSNNLDITNNFVKNTSILLKASRGISGTAGATSGVVMAEYNTIVNTPYCGLEITKDTNKDTEGNIIPSIGEAIMTHNVIYNEPEYLRFIERNSLMDGGAIYFGRGFGTTKVIANVIHHYWSKLPHGYSGIFVDDGQSNFTIKNNLIWAVKGATIHARTLAHDQLPGNKNNLNNYIGYNVLFGQYHFGGNATEGFGVGSEFECVSESNFLCKDMSSAFTPSENTNINVKIPDKTVSDSYIIGDTAFVKGLAGTITDEFILKYVYELK